MIFGTELIAQIGKFGATFTRGGLHYANCLLPWILPYARISTAMLQPGITQDLLGKGRTARLVEETDQF